MSKHSHRPRRGSLAFRNTSRKKAISAIKERNQVYYCKLGMTHVTCKNTNTAVAVSILQKIPFKRISEGKIELNFKAVKIKRKNLIKQTYASELENKQAYLITSITKGEGIIGPVEHRGLTLQKRNSSKNRRGVGAHGLRRPGYVSFRKHFMTRHGGNRRTYRNNKKINAKEENIMLKHTTISINDNILLLKGSIPGKKYTVVAIR